MDYFILLTWNSLGKKLDDDDNDTIMEYLQKNINNFKAVERYRDFVGEYPSIKIEIDKDNEFTIVNSYYYKLYDKIFDILSNTYNLRDAIINYDTQTVKLEIVDATVKGIFDLRYLNFIECNIVDGTYYKCNFENCEVKNSHIENCTFKNCEIFNCKVTNSTIDSDTTMTDVYFYGGYMDGEMTSGVFRGGIIGPTATIGDDVELVTKEESYFGDDTVEQIKKDGDDSKKSNIKDGNI